MNKQNKHWNKERNWYQNNKTLNKKQTKIEIEVKKLKILKIEKSLKKEEQEN